VTANHRGYRFRLSKRLGLAKELDAVLAAELDAVLAAADDELLGYIRATTDPEARLAVLMASDNGKMRRRRSRIPSMPGHPQARWIASRPWRDGRDVLNLALRHLPEVFVETPCGALLAPAAVGLLMSPADLSSLTELIDIDLVDSIIAERYEAEVAVYAARLPSEDPVQARVISDPAIPAGRYRLRRSTSSELARLR
jgi:hypothetical protein